MTLLTVLLSWFLLSLIVGPFVGRIIAQNSTPLDENQTND